MVHTLLFVIPANAGILLLKGSEIETARSQIKSGMTCEWVNK